MLVGFLVEPEVGGRQEARGGVQRDHFLAAGRRRWRSVQMGAADMDDAGLLAGRQVVVAARVGGGAVLLVIRDALSMAPRAEGDQSLNADWQGRNARGATRTESTYSAHPPPRAPR